MNKNNLIGFILIGLVLIGFSLWNRPSEEELAKQQQKELIEKKNKEEQTKAKTKADAARAEALQQATTDTSALFHKALIGEAKPIVLKNSKLTLQLNTKGGVVDKVLINNFTDRNGHKDLTLFQGKDQSLNYTFATKDGYVSTADLFFTPSEVTDTTVTFTAEAAAGKTLTIKYVLDNEYMLHTSISATGMGGILNPSVNTVDINWQERCAQQEKGFTFENRYASLTYHKTEGGTDYLSESSEKIDEVIEDKIDWVAFKNQFFSAVMIAKTDFGTNATLTSIPQEKGSGYLKQYQAKLKTAFDPTGAQPTQLDFYYGPNDFRLLQKMESKSHFGKDLELERLVYLGWPLFRIINRWFTLYVFDWLTGLNINMGVVLILITLLLKFITFPLVKKSYLSSAKMCLSPNSKKPPKSLTSPKTK